MGNDGIVILPIPKVKFNAATSAQKNLTIDLHGRFPSELITWQRIEIYEINICSFQVYNTVYNALIYQSSKCCATS